MAYETGTATDHADLYAKLTSFLTTNADLVAAEQQWEQVWTQPDGDQIVLKGPGLSGQDSVFVGMVPNSDPVADNHRISIVGMQGVIQTATEMAEHVGVGHWVRMFTDSAPMTYWFVANGRRFVVVAKMSTVYQTLYGGLFLPYANPLSYPYPLFIGGSSGAGSADPLNWRSTSDYHRHFFDPSRQTDQGNVGSGDGSAKMLDPLGQWRHGYNLLNGGVVRTGTGYTFFLGPLNVGLTYGFISQTASFPETSGAYRYCYQKLDQAFGGGFVLQPVTIVQDVPDSQTLGILDGVFQVAGFGNAAENIITVDGVDHLVVQNVFRTDTGAYWALALE